MSAVRIDARRRRFARSSVGATAHPFRFPLSAYLRTVSLWFQGRSLQPSILAAATPRCLLCGSTPSLCSPTGVGSLSRTSCPELAPTCPDSYIGNPFRGGECDLFGAKDASTQPVSWVRVKDENELEDVSGVRCRTQGPPICAISCPFVVCRPSLEVRCF
jgi:hypothetical protein